MKRVIVTRPIVGIVHMQVCAVEDATDEEILAVCNRENRAGTTHGWTTVIRCADAERAGVPSAAPVRCASVPTRMHFLVSC